MTILTGLWCWLSNSLPWVCLSLFHLRRVAGPGHELGSTSWCRRGLSQGLVVHLWQRGLTWRVGMRLMQVARSLLVATSPPVLPILGGKGSMGVGTPNVSQSSASLSFSSAVFQVGLLFMYLINEALHLTGLCLIWFGVTILSFWSHPSLFCNIWQFNVKAAVAPHPIIQKEVDELLDKRVIEPSPGGAGFYSSIFVVPKHTEASGPYLT